MSIVQVVFDKVSLANKILKEGPIKVTEEAIFSLCFLEQKNLVV